MPKAKTPYLVDTKPGTSFRDTLASAEIPYDSENIYDADLTYEVLSSKRPTDYSLTTKPDSEYKRNSAYDIVGIFVNPLVDYDDPSVFYDGQDGSISPNTDKKSTNFATIEKTSTDFVKQSKTGTEYN